MNKKLVLLVLSLAISISFFKYIKFDSSSNTPAFKNQIITQKI